MTTHVRQPNWEHIAQVCDWGKTHMERLKAPEAAVTGLQKTRRLAHLVAQDRGEKSGEDKQALIISLHKTACEIERQALGEGHSPEYQSVCYRVSNELDDMVTHIENYRAQLGVRYGTETALQRTAYRLF